MPSTIGIWLRQESSATEQRTPLAPSDAATLVAQGIEVSVERSEHRAFPIEEYAAAGCRIVAADSWPDASPNQVILGLKEPSQHRSDLTHRHVFFGHAYKGQEGGPGLLQRFIAGGGTLLDLEYLTDENGHRVVAFGYWAGYVGAALAVLHHRGDLHGPLTSMTRADLDTKLQRATGQAKALVIGALGRSGRGARDALAVAGIHATAWDVAETRDLDRLSLLAHDILVNTVFADEPGTPFLTAEDLHHDGRSLTVVSDVTCDVTSACNRIAINDKVTSWDEPIRCLHEGPPPLDVIAIDNLPSLVPRESSMAFSAGLVPHLLTLPSGGPIWNRCEEHFHHACRQLTID